MCACGAHCRKSPKYKRIRSQVVLLAFAASDFSLTSKSLVSQQWYFSRPDTHTINPTKQGGEGGANSNNAGGKRRSITADQDLHTSVAQLKDTLQRMQSITARRRTTVP